MNQDMLLPLHIITSHLTISAHFSINLPTYSKWIPPSTRYLLNSLSVINNIIANITNTIIVINIAKFLVVQTLVIIFIFIRSSLSPRPVICWRGFWPLGGSKNTNFQNSIGALSNPISFALRISKQFLFLFKLNWMASQKKFGINGNFNGKMTKINKMAKNHFPGSKMVPKVAKWGF